MVSNVGPFFLDRCHSSSSMLIFTLTIPQSQWRENLSSSPATGKPSQTASSTAISLNFPRRMFLGDADVPIVLLQHDGKLKSGRIRDESFHLVVLHHVPDMQVYGGNTPFTQQGNKGFLHPFGAKEESKRGSSMRKR
jgi:hypothetical protein